MYNSQELATLIKNTAKSNGVSVGEMLTDCNLSKNTLSSMLSGGYLPRIETLAKIADYLNCSVDYLLGRTENPKIAGNTEDTKSKKHDKTGQYGFDAGPELLAHELTMLMLSKRKDILDMSANELYDAYVKSLHDIETEIGSRIRYDSLFDK